MQRLRTALLGISSAASLFIHGCKPLPFEDVALDEVKFLTRFPQRNPVSLEALILGRLWIVDRCVTIGASADNSRTVIWRGGYRVGKDAKGMFVYHPGRKARHRIGDKVRFGGGYTDTLAPNWVAEFVEGGSLLDCPGPYIFVDTTGDE